MLKKNSVNRKKAYLCKVKIKTKVLLGTTFFIRQCQIWHKNYVTSGRRSNKNNNFILIVINSYNILLLVNEFFFRSKYVWFGLLYRTKNEAAVLTYCDISISDFFFTLWVNLISSLAGKKSQQESLIRVVRKYLVQFHHIWIWCDIPVDCCSLINRMFNYPFRID